MIEYGKTYNLLARDPETHKLTSELSFPEFDIPRHWIVTEKLDGTNIRVIIDPWKTEVRGRSDKANMPKGLTERILERLPEATGGEDSYEVACGALGIDPEKYIDTDFGPARPTICLYGEGFGAGIQKSGGIYSPEKRFAAFDVATSLVTDDGQPASGLAFRGWEDMIRVTDWLNLDTVPLLGLWADLAQIVSEVKGGFPTVAHSGGSGSSGPAEGIVARTDPYLYFGRNRSRLIFKLKTKDIQHLEFFQEQPV